jgi:hypothetical protein
MDLFCSKEPFEKKLSLVKWTGYFYTLLKTVTKCFDDGATSTCHWTTVHFEECYSQGVDGFLGRL